MIHYIILIDTSHSMRDKIENIIFSLNSYILKNKHKNNVYFTIAYFNNEMYFLTKMTNVNLISKPISITDLSYFGGFTALYDSVYDIIQEFGSTRNIHHSLFIITDGNDNASKKYDKQITENICDQYIKSGLWTIIHFHTHDVESLFNISNEIEINNDNLENLFGNLKI